MAGLMKGMGSYRAEPSPKVTILDTPKAAPQPRLLALEDARPEPPVLPAKPLRTHLRVESDAPLRWRRKWMLRLVVSPLKRICSIFRKVYPGLMRTRKQLP